MRLIAILLTAAAMFVAPSAGAIELSLFGASVGGSRTIGIGEEITIELRMSNVSQSEIFGLGASAHQYSGPLDFVSGRAVRRYLADFDNAFLPNLAGTVTGTGAAAQRALAQNAIGANGNRVQIALSAATAPNLGNDPSTDPGLDNVVGTAMFRLVFRGAAEGVATILFDSSYQGDLVNLAGGASEEIAGTSFTVTVVPEPGTALLMGLGLAGLAAAGRRE